MDASYLRVKNWSKLQHYSDRRPPWIKLWQGLLGDDDVFERLDEATQWQLVRIWLVASRSSAVVVDEEGKQVPVVANDAVSLQRSIQSAKKVPLSRLIRDGWLIPVAESELVPADQVKAQRKRRASAGASTGASAGASTGASAGASTGASVALRSRGLEDLEVQELPGRQFVPETDETGNGLPFENELLVARLLARIGDHADTGTRHIVASYARRLPPAAVAKVIESLDDNQPADRARYAVGALRDELAENAA